jgi:predicted DNA-binding transcriptional regulator YafY
LDKFAGKYNNSCVALFEFLKLLSSGSADHKSVIKLLNEHLDSELSSAHVTLHKYLNTLKIFGIQVKKDNNRFYLLNSPYKIDLTAEDLEAAAILRKYLNELPDSKDKAQAEQFFKDLEIRYNENTRKLSELTKPVETEGLSFCTAELSEQIKQCEKYCEDKYQLNITYINKKNAEEKLMFCSPVETICRKGKICLCVYKHSGSQIMEIPLSRIKSIDRLPVPAANNPLTTTVIFKIKGRLAKNYRLREWEILKEIEPDGSLVIKNTNEDFDILLRRLMRYGPCCVVSSPKILREMMKELIDETLAHYK